jgi:hypothetical protein
MSANVEYNLFQYLDCSPKDYCSCIRTPVIAVHFVFEIASTEKLPRKLASNVAPNSEGFLGDIQNRRYLSPNLAENHQPKINVLY